MTLSGARATGPHRRPRLLEGGSNSGIAALTTFAEKTVEARISRIFAKSSYPA